MDEWRYKSAGDFGMPMQHRLKSVRRESGLVSSLTSQAWWMSTTAYLRVYHRLSIRGQEHLPAKPPFIMIANHTSHLDILQLAAALPMRLRDCAYPIAAGDTFFETRVRRMFSWMMLGALPMWRKKSVRHAIEDLRNRMLEEPVVYLLFPEGTRTRTGEIGHFKPGLGMLVAGTDIPVVPCRLSGGFESMPPGAKIPRPRKLRVTIGEPRQYDSIVNERQGWNSIVSELEQVLKGIET
ncbi:MAG: lysophospholipid acyltransferase family protein [Planctomycetota bacterium]|nr:lysophospholipid acyltransferase family protein [Planctomycetota bacterium]